MIEGVLWLLCVLFLLLIIQLRITVNRHESHIAELLFAYHSMAEKQKKQLERFEYYFNNSEVILK